MVRTVLRDRVSASAIMLLVAFLFLIQGLISGQAQGAMAASAVDPLGSICSVTGQGPIGDADYAESGDRASHGKAADCPCSTLCRLAAHPAPAILGADSAMLHVGSIGIAPVILSAGNATTPTLRGLIGEPRAPPPIS